MGLCLGGWNPCASIIFGTIGTSGQYDPRPDVPCSKSGFPDLGCLQDPFLDPLHGEIINEFISIA